MLLVLGGVARDGSVAELAELDPELLGRDAVRAVADDRPIPLRRSQLLGGDPDLGASGGGGLHRGRKVAKGRHHRRVDGAADLLGDGPRQQEARGDLA